MPIKIQNTQTRRTYEIDEDAKLFYHVLEPIKQKRLLFANMINGKVDQDHIFEMSYDFMAEMLEGWEGIIDEATDKPIEFKKELITIIPLEVAVDFVIKVVMPSFADLITSANKILPKDAKGDPIAVAETTEGNSEPM